MSYFDTYEQEPDDESIVVDLPSSEYTAKKKHTCDYCGGWIEVGTKYRVQKFIVDGYFQTMKTHLKGSHDDALLLERAEHEIPF